MLSAVESHFGPNRSYASGAHHYTGNSSAGISANTLSAPCPIIPLANPMATAEFARPHPKPNRYNGQSLRNGMPSAARSKYSSVDQSAPVNLAVSQDANASAADALALSHKMSDVAALTKPSALESEQDAISSSIAKIYQHKLPYCPPETSTSLYYPSFYPSRAPTNYGPMYTPSPTSSHSLSVSRGSMHHGVPTYPNHMDPYPSPYFMGATAYSPPTPAQPLLSPKQPIGSITSQSNNTSISAQSVLSISPPSIFAQQQQHHHQHQHSHQHLHSHQHQHQQQHQQQHQHQQHPHQPHQQHQHHQHQPHQHQPLQPHQPQQQQQQQQKSREQYQLRTSPKTDYPPTIEQPAGHLYRSEAKEKEHNGKAVDFKIPSGKEGSMKHRILTRPYEKEPSGQKHSKPLPQPNSPSNSVTKSPASVNGGHSNGISNGVSSVKPGKTTTDKAANFSKGTLIELSSGEVKRVEDMRTEDFISSSCKNPNLLVINTTVIKMVLQSTQVVLITLAYKNRKIYIETEPTHPFFVYGKGWASYHPEETLKELGLKCEMLQVGDVCISLTPRDSKAPAPLLPPSVPVSKGYVSTGGQLPASMHKSLSGRHAAYDAAAYAAHGWPNGVPMERHDGRKHALSAMAPPPPPIIPDPSNGVGRGGGDEPYEIRSKKRRAISVPDNCDEPKKSKAK